MAHTHMKSPNGRENCFLAIQGTYRENEWYEKERSVAKRFISAFIKSAVENGHFEVDEFTIGYLGVPLIVLDSQKTAIIPCPSCGCGEFKIYMKEIIEEGVCQLRLPSDGSFTWKVGH